MGVGFGIDIINPSVVYAVNPYFTVRMDDMVVFHDDADMNDVPLIIIKKSEVSSGTFFNKT